MLLSTNHGTMIVNRNDYRLKAPNDGYGVGFQLMTTSSYEQGEIDFALGLIFSRKTTHGDGVIAIDCGANIGVHTVEWARLMTGWGSVHSFEAQEALFYALAGNIAINNCFNVRARLAAVGEKCGRIAVPDVDYRSPCSFGSLELIQASDEYIGQVIDYSRASRIIDMITIDSLRLARVDFIKIDVEGMEIATLRGAADVLERYKPLLLIEVIKTDKQALDGILSAAGYKQFAIGPNIIAAHALDPVVGRLAEIAPPA